MFPGRTELLKQTTLDTHGHNPAQASVCPQSGWETAQPARDSRRPYSAMSHLFSEYLLTSDIEQTTLLSLVQDMPNFFISFEQIKYSSELSSFQAGGNTVFSFLGVPPPLWALLKTLGFFQTFIEKQTHRKGHKKSSQSGHTHVTAAQTRAENINGGPGVQATPQGPPSLSPQITLSLLPEPPPRAFVC